MAQIDQPTGLAQWLDRNGLSAYALANELGVSPHTIGKVAKGRCQNFNIDILSAISRRTGLSYETILAPANNLTSPTATGDHRIDTCLALQAKHMHTPEMFHKCKRYIAPNFQCSGKSYNYNRQQPVGFAEMCDLNIETDAHIVNSLLSVSWYTPGSMESNDSHCLHTYWRALILIPKETPLYNDTFVVYEFAKSINEMEPIDLPQIVTWWWDTPSQYNRAPMESYPADIKAKIRQNASIINTY